VVAHAVALDAGLASFLADLVADLGGLLVLGVVVDVPAAVGVGVEQALRPLMRASAAVGMNPSVPWRPA
jgi:hypothetical protein